MYQDFEQIHSKLEETNDRKYKGTQLYFSPLKQSEILFIGINPGIGYYKFNKKNVKRFSPLNSFEYSGQKYLLATQSKKIFKELGLGHKFSQAVKINQFPFATANERELQLLLNKHDKALKLYYHSKKFVLQTIEIVQPKLIICEGKSSFDRLKKLFQAKTTEYNENTYVFKHNDFVVIGYRRHLSFVKDRNELKEKIQSYYINAAHNNV